MLLSQQTRNLHIPLRTVIKHSYLLTQHPHYTFSLQTTVYATEPRTVKATIIRCFYPSLTYNS